MGKEYRSNTKIVNNTKEPLPLFTADGEKWTEVPPNGGRLMTFTGAQTAKQKEFASRVKIDWEFVKCMVSEQDVMDWLKDDTKTYFALNVLKYYLLYNYNYIVKTTEKNGKEKVVKFTAEDLGKIMGGDKAQTRQSGSRHIKKLKELGIIKQIKTEDYGVVFVMNPNYYMNGSSVPKEIWELFSMAKGK